jgi:hypothetical protein
MIFTLNLLEKCTTSSFYTIHTRFIHTLKYSHICTTQVTIQMLEIYNEQVRDLFTKTNPSGGLKVRMNPKSGVEVVGLSEWPVGRYVPACIYACGSRNRCRCYWALFACVYVRMYVCCVRTQKKTQALRSLCSQNDLLNPCVHVCMYIYYTPD